MKTCTKCKENKSLGLFNKRNATKDGYNNHCRSCTTLAKKIRRLNNYDGYRQTERKWRKENPIRIMLFSAKKQG